MTNDFYISIKTNGIQAVCKTVQLGEIKNSE